MINQESNTNEDKNTSVFRIYFKNVSLDVEKQSKKPDFVDYLSQCEGRILRNMRRSPLVRFLDDLVELNDV